MFGKKKELKELSLEQGKEAAWNNAPIISDKPVSEYRVCMYCQFPMKHDEFIQQVSGNKKALAWTIDLVNINKSGNDPDNLLAVHDACKKRGLRKKDNQKHILKIYKNTKWMFPKN